MQIKKFNTGTNISFSRFVSAETTDTEITLNYKIDIDDDLLKLVITNQQEDNKTYYNVVIDFSIIKSHPEFDSQTLWEVPTTLFLGTNVDGELDNPALLARDDIKNKLKETYFDRATKVNNYSNVFPPIRIFVPSKTSELSDCIICVPTPNDVVTEPTETGYTKDINVIFTGAAATATVTSANNTGWKQLCSAPIATELSRDSNSITVSVTVDDETIPEVWLEQVYGGLNTSRVVLQNGSGSFKINTSDLSEGSPVRVKLGYKYISGLSNFTATI
jgi:hypothetical protein